VAGPAGPQGDQGADGAVGPVGPSGVEGPAGVKGDQGIQGEPGIQGIQGEQGPAGLGITFKGSIPTVDDLPDGAEQGDLYVVETPAPATAWVWDEAEAAYVDGGPVQGPQGIQGQQGIPGVQGPAGNDGAPGSQGPAGADGAAGPAGPKGDTGATGPQGPPGADGTGTAYTLPVATSTVLGGVKVGTGLAVDGTGTLTATAATGFLPLAGGTMTGTITLPSGTVGMAVNGTNYNMLGGSGGVAFRSGTTNIINHTAAEITAYVPITTPATGVGVRFGSGGPSLSKSGTTIASSAPITVAAAPATATEVANKAYVDAAVAAGGGGGGSSVTNPVAGSVAGMVLWTGTQAQYDAISTKSATTVYYIV
jgi:hypothetical protein